LWWFTAATDQGRSDSDHEKRPQAVPLVDERPPPFVDFRAIVYVSCKNIERTLNVGVFY
jgi:hypothetical protein